MNQIGVTEAERMLYLPRRVAADVAAERNAAIPIEPQSTAAARPIIPEASLPHSHFVRHPDPWTGYIEGNRAERRRREQAQRRAMKRTRAQQRERGR
jgi:hypothetical protein